MVGMPLPFDPSVYWSASSTRESQRLYVCFCELASAALDYAEGHSLLRRDERRHGAARLNWAGTAFYYSLVHSARFLVFSAVGDFPTQHNRLSQAFCDRSPGPVSTNWLGEFLSAPKNWTTQVGFKALSTHWATALPKGEVEAHLSWVADAMYKAKKLRNENNYEALLIAHEFDHPYLKDSFKDLARAMKAVAKPALSAAVGWYARLLLARTGQSNGDAEHETNGAQAAFIQRYVKTRIIEAGERWYGTTEHVVSKDLASIMAPLSELNTVTDQLRVQEIEDAISLAFFDPKVGLMDSFKNKIAELQDVVRDWNPTALREG